MFKFWNKKKDTPSLDEQFRLSIKRGILRRRTVMACTDTTDHELMLRNFCTNNKNNQRLLAGVADYWKRSIAAGLLNQQAAKETLEYFRH